MKKIFFFQTIFLLVFAIACEENTSEPGIITSETIVSDIDFSGCILTLKSNENIIAPSLHLTCTEESYLLVEAFRTEFCCGTDSITILDSINENQMVIEILDEGPFTYCICEHNVSFKIGPMEQKTYSLTFLESENSYYRDTFTLDFNFNPQLDTTITPDVPSATEPFYYETTLLGGCNGI